MQELNPVNANSARITFRVAQANHKEGPSDSPDRVYRQILTLYNSTTNGRNIFFYKIHNSECRYFLLFANQPQGDFFGYVEPDMTLVGRTSGAQATITNVRLISDIAALWQGVLYSRSK